jgi:hypothetical protein
LVRNIGGVSGNRLAERLTHIQESLLKRHDPALFLRLEKLEIYPQLYGIRLAAGCCPLLRYTVVSTPKTGQLPQF